jgi:phosphatidylserine/phosphatidylglycerophosphate/cardiolipin synthase-like enzyme
VPPLVVVAPRPPAGAALSPGRGLVGEALLCHVVHMLRRTVARRDGATATPSAVSAVPVPTSAAPAHAPATDGGEQDHDWFLTASQRGNPATRLRPWTEGNAARPRVHGAEYFAALADALDDVGRGDVVLFTDWRGDPDERVRDGGPTIVELLVGAVRRGGVVKGLVWRSHLDRLRFSGEENRDLSEDVCEAGGEVLLDQRVRPLGSHHQKFVVVRHPDRPADDVAFVGGIDLAHSRRDDADHAGDPQTQRFSRRYGPTPAWHDAQVELRGPAVADVEVVFRERWQDPAALSRLPWHAIPDIVRGDDRRADRLPPMLPDPPVAGTCAVQLLRTYPNRRPGYPFAPDGERSVARAYAKALGRARRLVYVEDQYLWSTAVARVFADALRREPGLHLVAVVPRYPDQDDPFTLAASRLGHAQALDLVRAAGGDRVQVFDVENRAGEPVYVHSKVCVVDDVWATIGSDNFNRRSWTHDSELSAAIVDSERDPREPRDPAGLGDGARRFARDLRLALWREHLDAADDDGLVDPADAVETMRRTAQALDAWYAGGRQGPRPPGRLRPHSVRYPPPWQRWIAAAAYRAFLDPDGRPPRLKVRRGH